MGYRSMHIAQVALVFNFWWGNSKCEKDRTIIDETSAMICIMKTQYFDLEVRIRIFDSF